MTDLDSSLVLGSPRFNDPRIAALAAQSGTTAAWRDAGPAGLAQVAGAFAVGLREASGRCWLAVDRFGIESICWRIDGGRLRFAARADELADADPAIDPQAIFDYLYFHSIPSPRTIYRDVFRLPPGCVATFENGRISVERYWQPRFTEPAAPDVDALAVEFRQLLRDAVEAQLDGHSRPACFLSGGTDSSTVAGMIGEVAGTKAATYSIGFDAQGYDEMEFARIAARHFGTEHHEYYVTPDDVVRGIGAVASHFDQPFGNSSALPAYYCAKMARDDGVQRLLAGDGGDELFGGNSRYAKQRIFGWWGGVPAPLRTQLLEPMFERQTGSGVPLLRKAASYVEQAKVPMPDRMQMYNLLLRLGPAQVLTPALLARIDQTLPLQQQRFVWDEAPAGSSELNRQLAFEWRYTLAESDLPKVRGATGLAGVEVGFPLLDDRLLEFSCRLPTSYKLQRLKLRWFFKQALRGFLPDEIIAKKKQGFGLPFGVWANGHPKLKALASDSLRGIAERGIVPAAFVEELLQRRLPEHPGYYGEMVWILMMLEQWLRAKAPRFRLEA